MAIGLARMFNLRFPLNFNAPYKAGSVIEYWQRWHMTLTRYLTLLLFNPLALAATRRRARRGRAVGRAGQATPGGFAAMVAGPILLTMTLAGIWHGSGWTFIAFGLLHGVYLVINHAWNLWGPRRKVPGRVALTYLAVLAGAVVFRAPSLTIASRMLADMAGAHGLGWPALEGALSRGLEVLGPLGLAQAASAGPARRFGLPGGTLAPGAPADATVFDPACAWTAGPSSPAAGRRLTGRALLTVVAGRVVFSLDDECIKMR
jgi:hypothetical protein